MHRGYIKLWRKISEWGWYKSSETLHIFIHLLLNANYKTTEYLGTKIERGQIVTGRKSLSEKTGISERSVRTAIERLKSTNELTIKTTNKFSVITLCNYETYNSDEDIERPTERPAFKPTTDQQPTNNRPHLKNYKERNIYIDEIYALYPSKDINNGNRSTGKNKKDKEKIEKILREKTVDEIKELINQYVSYQYKTKAFLKNFSTFLNQLPETPTESSVEVNKQYRIIQ